MKRLLYTLAALCLTAAAYSQEITGLWKGTIYNDSTKKSLPYEIVISKENGKLTGWSHTSFMVDGKMYYGIKKVKVRVAKDGKVLVQDAELLENNYPAIDKNVYQLNVLAFSSVNDEAVLDGPFATNRTKQYGELTGHINLKKITRAGESSALMDYLQKNGADNGIAISK